MTYLQLNSEENAITVLSFASGSRGPAHKLDDIPAASLMTYRTLLRSQHSLCFFFQNQGREGIAVHSGREMAPL